MVAKLPTKSCKDRNELRLWLEKNSTTSNGLQVRLFKVRTKFASISFQELLEKGLCFGWSESKRHPCDELSYIQFFTPRKIKGTISQRNKLLVERLIKENKMTDKGLSALNLAGRNKINL